MIENNQFENIENYNPRLCVASRAMKVQRIISGIFRKHLKGFDLTTPQLSMLFVLTKGGEKSQKELADKLYLEKSSVNRNIKKLLEKKYIENVNFPLLGISFKGKKLVEEVIPFWQTAMDECDNILEEDGIAALDLVLNKLTTKQ
ncbi:MAG: MarR family winged helix-turn-helix transcriptional regulator [Chitinophagales bacterium]